jgi:hypothetical protein
MKIAANKVIAGIIGGFGFTMIGSICIAMAMHKVDPTRIYSYSIPILWMIGIAIALIAQTGAKAWRRLFIISGIECLSFPIIIFLFFMDGTTSGLMASTAFSWIMAVPSFFLGAILLVVGLLIGRDKVVYVTSGVPLNS